MESITLTEQSRRAAESVAGAFTPLLSLADDILGCFSVEDRLLLTRSEALVERLKQSYMAFRRGLAKLAPAMDAAAAELAALTIRADKEMNEALSAFASKALELHGELTLCISELERDAKSKLSSDAWPLTSLLERTERIRFITAEIIGISAF